MPGNGERERVGKEEYSRIRLEIRLVVFGGYLEECWGLARERELEREADCCWK